MDQFIEFSLKSKTPVEKIAEHLMFHYHGRFATREAAIQYVSDYLTRTAPARKTVSARAESGIA